VLLDHPEARLAISLGIGLVIGAERERRKAEESSRVQAGVRTFALIALLGGVIFALDNTALLVVGAIGVGGAAAVGFFFGEPSDPGLTTAVALLLTYCLGALALREPTLALACGLCTACLLAFRTTLHAAVRSVLSEDELRDALLLAIAAVVILPLLPNHTIDPLFILNPFRLWRLVVAFMAMSALGHVAQRAIGPRYGLAVAGFGSGFVSSAATIATMGARVRADASILGPAAAGVAASSVGTMIQLAILVGAADPRLLARIGWPLGVGAGVALIYAVLQTWRMSSGDDATARGHAFKLSTALLFATLVTVVSVASTLAMRWAGNAGLLFATALAGLADTHSASAAVASVSGSGQVATATAALGVLLALTTNTFTKCTLALSSGGRVFASRVVGGLVLMTAATWITYAAGVLR
jgi:uncharacterized membrane protein (DUF4010 family)